MEPSPGSLRGARAALGPPTHKVTQPQSGCSLPQSRGWALARKQPLQHHLSPSSLILQGLGNAKGEFLLFSVHNYDQLVQKEALHGSCEVQALCCKYFPFWDVPFVEPPERAFPLCAHDGVPHRAHRGRIVWG